MLCTIKIEYDPEWANFTSELKKLINRFEKVKKGNPNNPPLFWIKNFRVTTRNKKLIIEGSLARYFNGNNIEMFSWLDVKVAINTLSLELGLPLHEGILRRIDIGVNFEVDNEVTEYFPEIFHLHCYQRIHKHKTTLKFENNSNRYNFCFYDKKKEVENRKKNDIDEVLVSRYKNFMRIELQIEERLELFLKRKDSVKVSELFSQDLCKILMKKWLSIYKQIQKRGVRLFPFETKGRQDFDLLKRREFIETHGWEYLEYIFDKLVKQGSFTTRDKCEKKKQFTKAMLDGRPFIYQAHINELNRKIKMMCFETLINQLFKLPKAVEKKDK